MTQNSPLCTIAQEIADQFAQIPAVVAVGQGGSVTSGPTDKDSDIDLYVFTTTAIPVAVRQAIVDRRGASRADMNLTFWDPGDEWFDAPSGIEIDVMYWDPRWIEDQIDNVLIHHYASMGYTTCHWHTLRHVAILFDRENWLSALKSRCETPYPEELRQNIIAKNYPILRSVIPAYYNQIEKALKRGDRVSVNHRIAALLASYFDIIFALNRVPHPGEKRLLQRATTVCDQRPQGMTQQVSALLRAAASEDETVIKASHDVLDGLDNLLSAEGFNRLGGS
jgi:hypothetical protein